MIVSGSSVEATVTPSTEATAARRARSPRAIVAGLLAGIAIPFIVVGLSVLPFLTPVWIFPAQVRADADGWTGWPISTVHQVTGEVLLDLIVGPPAFDQTVDGQAVFSDRERSHLVDVRSVFLTFGGLVFAAIAVFTIAVILGRGTRGVRSGVRIGSQVAAAVVIALGGLAFVAFDVAFDVFHQLFFAAGTYTFDPTTDRLVQLFPESFWFETAVAVGAVIVVLGLLVYWRAGRSPASTET
jgi:integral membrane protein (TIGR01906 family)